MVSCVSIPGNIEETTINKIEKHYNFTIKKLQYNNLTGTNKQLAPLSPDFDKQDEDGIIMWEYKEKNYYHPLTVARTGRWYIDSYVQTGNKEYLQWAKTYGNKFLELSYKTDQYIYFPYLFDFALHGRNEETMKSPWYSGMAQGVALTFYSRLYNVTNDKRYLQTCQKIYNTYLKDKITEAPWISQVNNKGYYWIEEYPWTEPTHVLNGHIYGIYGLYEYYLVSKSEEVKYLLQSALTTVKDHLLSFRTPGGISKYCLKHKVKSSGYHRVHILQLRYLSKITGDSYFNDMANLFYEDYNN